MKSRDSVRSWALCSKGRANEIRPSVRNKCLAHHQFLPFVLRADQAGKNKAAIRLQRIGKSACKIPGQGEPHAQGQERRRRRRSLVRGTLRGVPWRDCAGNQEGAKFARTGGADRPSGSTLLDSDEWNCAKRDAGVVEIAGAPALAVGDI